MVKCSNNIDTLFVKIWFFKENLPETIRYILLKIAGLTEIIKLF